MDLSRVKISDGEITESFNSLGDWAEYAFKIGFESQRYSNDKTRLISILSVPARDVFVSLVALGAVVADASTYDDSDTLSWTDFKNLETGAVVYFRDRDRFLRGVVEEFDEQMCARIIRDQRSVSHYIFEHNFSSNELGFEKPDKLTGSRYENQDLILKVLSSMGISTDSKWLNSVYPKIVINTVKRLFKIDADMLELKIDNDSLPLSSLLKISESGKPGSGKLLLNTQKNAVSAFKPALAIISTRYFDKIIREYSFSNMLIILEHHEYDEAVSEIARLVRDRGEAVPAQLSFINNSPSSVKVMTKLMPRNTR